MTPKQTALYWREWAAVRRTAPAADRHELHARALGRDKSSKDFSNEDLDAVLAEFRAISRPADLSSQLRQQGQPKVRLIYAIRKAAPQAYTAAICRDRFGTTNLDDLSEPQLTQLRHTLAARSNAQRRKLWQPERAEPAAVAEESNIPF